MKSLRGNWDPSRWLRPYRHRRAIGWGTRPPDSSGDTCEMQFPPLRCRSGSSGRDDKAGRVCIARSRKCPHKLRLYGTPQILQLGHAPLRLVRDQNDKRERVPETTERLSRWLPPYRQKPAIGWGTRRVGEGDEIQVLRLRQRKKRAACAQDDKSEKPKPTTEHEQRAADLGQLTTTNCTDLPSHCAGTFDQRAVCEGHWAAHRRDAAGEGHHDGRGPAVLPAVSL